VALGPVSQKLLKGKLYPKHYILVFV
jgi:hypothetical protein